MTIADELIVLAALGSGLIGGVFFAFSNFVMKALDRIDPASGLSAMKSINVVVLNPLFLGVFTGNAIICVILAFLRWEDPWLLAGCLLYVIGTFGVTMVFNVPRNEALSKIDPGQPGAAEAWRGYVRSWTMWNHVRTVAALAAAVLLMI